MSRHAYLAAAALVAAAGVSIGLAGMSAATDSGAVAPTLASVKTSAPASFVPIDEEKAGLEMAQAQSRFLPVFDRAARTAGFGGAYFNGATPHLNVASGVDEEALLSPLAEFASSDTVRVHKVRWTYAELQGAAREMGDRGGDREEPFAIRQAQLDVRRNRVVLLVDGALPVRVLVVEVQLATDPKKRLSWPRRSAVVGVSRVRRPRDVPTEPRTSDSLSIVDGDYHGQNSPFQPAESSALNHP